MIVVLGLVTFEHFAAGDVNDNVPQFSPTSYTFYVDYYASPGAVVGAVTATDGDVGKYGVVTYSLEQTSLDKEYFAIDVTGRISVRISPSSGQLTYAAAISVTARASDVGGNEDTSMVLIIVSGICFAFITRDI